MQRLKKLSTKTSTPESFVTDSTQCATHDDNDKENLPDDKEILHDTKEGSHDNKEGSHDAKEDSHDSCGPMPVAITDEAESIEHKNSDNCKQENTRGSQEQQNTTNSNEQEIVKSKELENDGQDTSPSTPLPTVSSSIGSGLYIVGMHRKMVSIACE